MHGYVRHWLTGGLVLLPLALGCATAPYADTRVVRAAKSRGFPSIGLSLQDVVAGLHDRGDLDMSLTMIRMTLFRTDVSPWEEIPLEAAWTTRPAENERYAVISHRQCLSRMDLEVYDGDKIDWFMLSEGGVEAFDYYAFAARCTVSNRFEPAPLDSAALEREIRGWIAARHAGQGLHSAQIYRRGLRYLEVGRIDAAQEMLEEGDASFDSAARGSVTRFERERPSLITEADRDIASSRDQLIVAIARAKDAPAAAVDVSAPAAGGPTPSAAAAAPPISLAAVTAGAQLRNRALFDAWFKVLSAPDTNASGQYTDGAIRARNRRTGRVLETSAAAVHAGQSGWDAGTERSLGTYVEREWQSATFYGGSAEMPEWLPMYPEVHAPAENLRRTEGETERRGAVLVETGDSPDTVRAFYEGALRGAGFGRTSDDAGDRRLLTAIHPDGRKVRLSAAPDDRVTVLVLEWSQ